MDLTWINVVDTAVKIGLGALISAVGTYFALVKNQVHENNKEARAHFHKLQEEKKLKYIELLAQSQELIQSNLFTSCAPSSEEYKRYLRAFNEVQIISSVPIRQAASQLLADVQFFIFLNKNRQEVKIINESVALARERISFFQKVAQLEVTKCYQS